MTDREPDEDGVIRCPLTLQDMVDRGLLWMINRTLFHPRGYALAVDPERGTLELWGNGDEPWTFELPEDMENEKFQAFQALLAEVTR